MLDVETHSPRQHDFLQIPPFADQVLYGIPMTRPRHVLLDDRSLIQFLCGVMGRRPDELHAALVRLPVGGEI